MTTTELYREKVPIQNMPDMDGIVERFEQIRAGWPKRITFGVRDEPIDPTRDRNLYRGASLATFQRVLLDGELKAVDLNGGKFPYMIYEVDKGERSFIGSIMGISCPRYYRIYLQTSDGVIIQNCGEYSKSLTTTQILDLGAPDPCGTPLAA